MDHPGARTTLSRGATLWCIEREGNLLRTARGRSGRPARATLRACATEASAERLYARSVAAQYARGYRRTTAPGWPAACLAPEAVHTTFERRLRRRPRAPGLAEAYGAWLASQGDPRGSLAALQDRRAPDSDAARRASLRLAWLLDQGDGALSPAWSWRDPRQAPGASAPADARDGRAARALLRRYRRRFLKGLPEIDDGVEFTWHRGFLDSVTLAADEVVNDDVLPDGEILRRILRTRSARLLRALHIELRECEEYGGGPDPDPTLLHAILHGPPARALLSFSLGREPFYDVDPDDEFYDPDTARDIAPPLGDLRRLGLAFPRLVHLVLAGRALDAGDWRLPRLRHAELHFARPEEPAVAALARAAWPALRSLRLGLGNFRSAAEEAEGFAALGPILTAERLPQLRHLALLHPPDADAVCAVLARVPAAARLETLELACGGMTEAGARELARARPRLARLRHLNVADNFLTDDDEARLRRAFPGVRVHTGVQRSPTPRDLDDEAWIEELRLAAQGGVPATPTGVLRTEDDLPDHLDDGFELTLDRVAARPTGEDEPSRPPPPDASDDGRERDDDGPGDR